MNKRNYGTHKLMNVSVLTIFTVLFINVSAAFAQPDGAKLYKQNCAVCHRLDDKKLTGPGLAGVASRVPQPADQWLMKWIKDNNALRASGDAYANKVFNDNGGAAMTTFGSLSDEEIMAIITYFKNPPKEEPKPGAPAAGETVSAEPKGVNKTYLLIGISAFLLVLISVLRYVKLSLKNAVQQKNGELAQARPTLLQEWSQWLLGNKRRFALIVIVLSLVGMRACWNTLFEVGVFTGYKPTQPIAFSHKIHAGDNAINCVYCHNTVEKSKTASIPSVSVCMNCHKGIDKGPVTGTTEIAKIYEAAGWNPETAAYDKPQKPVKWVKVHNLPDFVYFNHSQHVVVGKQDCANCHGDVKTMTVAQQVQPLTMGWCIDCHRKTEVPGMKDNPYYADLHAKLAEKYKGQPITVDKMGGIECAKCHY